jgi:hypothetical protein
MNDTGKTLIDPICIVSARADGLDIIVQYESHVLSLKYVTIEQLYNDLDLIYQEHKIQRLHFDWNHSQDRITNSISDPSAP